MSIDAFQEKIRKTKNPSVLVVEAFAEWIPPHILQEAENQAGACLQYYTQLLEALKGIVPALRFGFGSFSLLGPEGMTALSTLMKAAGEMGYYVLLDAPEPLSVQSAENVTKALCDPESLFPCNGVVFSCWLGSDILKALLPLTKQGKSLFPVVRTANKSGAELQDVQTGGRMLFTASADLVGRLGETAMDRCGYARYAVMAGANSAGSLKTLRERYPKLFVMVDGLDGTGGNAKNASAAFDRVGHGALVCVSGSVFAAWQEAEEEGDAIAAAREAAERVKRNLSRYVTVL